MRRKVDRMYVDCHCRERGVIPLSCFSGEELQFAKNEHYCNGEVKTVMQKTDLSAILKLTPFVKNSSSPADAGEGKYTTFLRKRKAAFTLAEVLITLTIIGVIAAMTIPNLVKKYRNHANYVALKKNYSILQNAYKLSQKEFGPYEDYAPEIYTYYGLILLEKLKPYLNTAATCKENQLENCWYKNQREYNGIKLKDGTNIIIGQSNPGTGTSALGIKRVVNTDWKQMGIIIIDVNGNKLPNKTGYDIFVFGIMPFDKRGIVPAGVDTISEQNACYPNLTSNHYACTYKVLKEHGIFY